MPIVLRDYQNQAISEIRDLIKSGTKSIVLVAPTGSGKTAIAGAMIHGAAMKKKKILFLCHRRELIDQCSRSLDDLEVPHGIIRANDPRRKPWLAVHVASVPTLAKRIPPPADLIFIDEAHHATAGSYLKIIAAYPDAIFILLTATPRRLDGRGLGSLAKAMVLCPSVADLTERGFLVPARVYAPSTVDLSHVGKQAGEYKSNELAVAMDKPTITGDVVEHWLKLAKLPGDKYRLTICFAVNVEHSQHIAAQFVAAGIQAEHLDGETPGAQREAILNRFARGETKIICNVGVLTEGYDCPATSCIILCRPTLSESLYLQMPGRGLRTFPGKTDCLILDHANCTAQHGFVDDPREWTLDDCKKKKSKDFDPALSVRTCKICWCAFSSKLPACPSCNWVFVGQPREIIEKKGSLEEIVKRFVCSECKREMSGAVKEGDWCDWSEASSRGCMGTAKRAYAIKALSANPKIAAIQKEAEEKGHKPGWVHFKIQALRQSGGIHA